MASAKSPRKDGRSAALSKQSTPNRSSSRKDYGSDGVIDNDIFELPGSDWQLLGVLTIVAAAVRLFRIYQPTSVVFDEVHFGGFASKYINGKFFMDVHPPLAKMLIALFGWLAGFDGSFDFKDIGKDYLEPGVPYVAMRLFPAICGVITIPSMFLTLKAIGTRSTTAAMGAALLTFENGLLTNNRLILLDSPLVTATALTALTWTCFHTQHELGPSKAFSPSWWFWLVTTGLFLGATVSIKWVGLFTIGWVGSITLLQLWVLLGDPVHVTPRLWFKHFFARIFCLIIIPIAFYLAMFAIHFALLHNPGEGDGFMSSEFQATLDSKGMQDVVADVYFGSRVTLRHHATQGGYLHSHLHMYPEGSKQQQITLYPHKDENNIWMLENQTQPEGQNGPIMGPKAWDNLAPAFIKNGDVLRLHHATTSRRLHSHDQRPPVTEADWQQEVSCYGYEGFEGDANDFFKVEIIKSMSDGEVAKERVRTIQTKFRLVHIMTGCALFSHKVKLPDWAWEQQEVTCAKQGTLPNSIWYIEQNEHPALGPDAEKVNYRHPGFMGKFWELQKVMWQTNAGLTDSHAWDSRPPSWPLLKRGINFWGKDNLQIYLMGNPIVWLSSSAAIAVYLGVKVLAALRWQRGYSDYRVTTFKRFDYEVGMMVMGWAFHYLPFFLMSRQLFLHHYFPALYFAVIVLCQTYDFVNFRTAGIGLRERPAIGQAAAIAFIAVAITVFTYYAPLAYGNRWTKTDCRKVKLLDTWDWDCNNFHDSYDIYTMSPNPSWVDPTPSAFTHSNEWEDTPEGEKKDSVNVTPHTPAAHPAPGGPVVKQEKKVEFRDEKGNLLNEEQVKSLKENDVKFETKYETRTEVIDDKGDPIQQPLGGVHPPHPDVEGRNPNTAGVEKPGEETSSTPKKGVEAKADTSKEGLAEKREKSDGRKARPASENPREATNKR